MRQSKRRKMASLDAMDVATRFVNAANQHDADGLISCAHRDFQSIQPVHPDRSFRGVAQLRNNWEAIFRTEPGFRLTVLRATATDDTVWMEVHGAGDDEEAAGMFIFGVEQGRIRWIRVYSDIVETAPEPPAEVPAPVLTAVPEPETDDTGSDDAGSDDAVAPEAPAPEEADDTSATVAADLWDAVVADGNDVPHESEDDHEPSTDDEPSADTADGDEHETEVPPRKGWRRVLRSKA